MSISNYAENKLLDAVFKNVSFAVAAVYIKLHVGDPGEAGTANAATETTRKVVTFITAASGATENDVAVTWTNVAGSEDYTFFSLWDASTAGNCLWIGTVTANPVTAGDTFTIAIGDLDITLD